MKIIINFLIFCIVLFIYLHIQFHLKTSNELEIYELEEASKVKLEEVCDLRQPLIFKFEDENMVRALSKKSIVDNYSSFEIKIRNIQDDNKNSELYIPLPLHSSIKLFNEDKGGAYYSENNTEFLNETGLFKHYKYNDIFLRPPMVSNLNYDLMMASKDTWTPFRYEINYRNYFLVTQGSIEIKFTPPQNIKYLHPEYDYENFEFRSAINPWKVQSKYESDFNKMKCLEVNLTRGQIIYIPAYWWYSIRFSNDTSVACFRYRTYLNNLAISPYIFMHILQLQNIKRESTNKLPLASLNSSSSAKIDLEEKDKNDEFNNNDNNQTTSIEQLNTL